MTQESRSPTGFRVLGFGLSAVQADAVLQMPLRRLTSLEGGKLEEEHAALEGEVKGLKDLLQTRQKVLEVPSHPHPPFLFY